MEPRTTTGNVGERGDRDESVSYLGCLINGKRYEPKKHTNLFRKEEKCSFSVDYDLTKR